MNKQFKNKKELKQYIGRLSNSEINDFANDIEALKDAGAIVVKSPVELVSAVRKCMQEVE